ncbi:BlaI/MecI/CopY family transcriptional regulator [Aliikangiella maris]|uniref:BlaI/MecI/CopY family transcriptional regulator n=2 Tax=Aliikangiella maris TaxID=3162458 RepID=A0ABV2BSD0_9GAMM
MHEKIMEKRDVTYSTVKTIIDRLEKKQAIQRVDQSGRTIFYGALIQPARTKKFLIQSFIQRVFGGQNRPLFNHLLNEEALSIDDIKYLEKLIANF